MTKVTFSLQEDKILAVDILGHAGYAEHIRFTLPKGDVERGQDALCALKLHFSELEQNYSDFLNVMEVQADAED